jgi:hypothetical protein
MLAEELLLLCEFVLLLNLILGDCCCTSPVRLQGTQNCSKEPRMFPELKSLSVVKAELANLFRPVDV